MSRAGRAVRTVWSISTPGWAMPIAPPRGAPPTIRSSTEPSMPPRSAKPKPATPPAAAPTWLRPLLLALTAILFLTWFSGAVADTDIWLHLMTGRHTLETRALTVPDPFSYTSNLTSTAYPDEAKTRYFNLTHEWLAQILMYLIHASTGFAGLVLLRALLLVAFCGLVGLMVWWRTGGVYRSLVGAIPAGGRGVYIHPSPPLLACLRFFAPFPRCLRRLPP